MATKITSVSQDTLALYDKLIEAIPGLERKGATYPYTSLNGHMFSMIDGENSLALRLPKELIEEFLKKYKTTNQLSYGVVRKDYAVVPEKLLKNTKELTPYFIKSYEYIATLKPKPTTKPKKK